MSVLKYSVLALFLVSVGAMGLVMVEPESAPPAIRESYERLEERVETSLQEFTGDIKQLESHDGDDGGNRETVARHGSATDGSSSTTGSDADSGVDSGGSSTGIDSETRDESRISDTDDSRKQTESSAETTGSHQKKEPSEVQDTSQRDGSEGDSSDTSEENNFGESKVDAEASHVDFESHKVDISPRDIDPSDNPWSQRKVTVGIDKSVDPNRDYASYARIALNYWMNNLDKADYRMFFEVVPDANNPDVEIVVKETIDTCNRGPTSSITAGCTKLIENKPNLRIPNPVKLKIDWSLSNKNLVTVFKHEFGHILGLDHNDEPIEIMRHNASNYETYRLPWSQNTTHLYVKNPVGIDDTHEFFGQMEHVTRYYRDRLGKNITVTRQPGKADVFISVTRDMKCSEENPRVREDEDHASCPSKIDDWNSDGDRDVKIKLNQLYGSEPKVKAAGWHVGYWLSRLYGYDKGNVPEAFDPKKPGRQRVEWWK